MIAVLSTTLEPVEEATAPPLFEGNLDPVSFQKFQKNEKITFWALIDVLSQRSNRITPPGVFSCSSSVMSDLRRNFDPLKHCLVYPLGAERRIALRNMRRD